MTAQTHPNITHELQIAARKGLLPSRGGGWLAGFGNMFSKEMGEWFHTRRWVWQLITWVTILGGFIAFLLFALPAMVVKMPALQATLDSIYGGFPVEDGAIFKFFGFIALTGVIGAVILSQDEIIQEKQSGTAAWIISKPVARPAFILTKLLSNIIGMLLFIVIVPGMVVMGEVYLATHHLVPLLPFLAGCLVMLLALVFYTSLTIMLGVTCESRGAILGIPFGIFLFGQILAPFFPQLAYGLPLAMDGIAFAAMKGIPLPPMLISELISVSALTIVFILVALWKFQRKEL